MVLDADVTFWKQQLERFKYRDARAAPGGRRRKM
jgi:hypothetical protein